MTSTGSYEDLFRKEISKYDRISEDIAHNIEAQEQLLLQIQAQNDDFSAIFNLEDYKASREKCYKQIQAAIAKFREIKENINEGLKFYVTLQDAITNVKQQCSDFVMTRNIQCREMTEDVQRQMAGLNFQDNKNAGAYNNYPSVGHQNQRSNVSGKQILGHKHLTISHQSSLQCLGMVPHLPLIARHKCLLLTMFHLLLFHIHILRANSSSHMQAMSMANLLIRGGEIHTTIPMHNNLNLILGLLTPSQLHTLLLTKVATISNNSVAVYHLSILAI
ncbi:vacuolar-sorting protein BRO1-like [Castanea sativa]|uniref:vacuolar-sorting protein BRO1-like n=1 Tax=Castanea sativa TaxID=21020 RepID=UPI003F64950F